ncbi:MAG: hypothetical protein RL318_929 [Fibrobacterota bacterium]|jgi:hypothetical protein
MYSEQDLDQAVEAGIFTPEAVEAFKVHVFHQRPAMVENEKLKVLAGLNDIFILLASLLTVVSGAILGTAIHKSLGGAVVAVLAWALSELFIRKLKKRTTGIGLMVMFSAGTAWFLVSLVGEVIAPVVLLLPLVVHWLRFRVPVTVSLGLGVVGWNLFSLGLHYKLSQPHILLLALGILTTLLAIVLDSQDTRRETDKSDIAFWMHIVGAALIVHSAYYTLSETFQQESIAKIAVFIGLYLALSTVSLVIDRRAMMVSATGYVVYAISKKFGDSQMETGISVGAGLVGIFMLWLSIAWHRIRERVLRYLPVSIRQNVPEPPAAARIPG